MEEKKVKPYDVTLPETGRVEEPFVMYGTLDLDESKRYTYADYLTWLDDKRRELINGLIHLMSAPNELHARVSFNWGYWMSNFIRKRKSKCRIYHAPFDVRLPINGETANDKIYNVVQPDICVVCDLSKLDDKGCIGAPDLVVEVSSPSTSQRDLNHKFFLYESSGVSEYWVVYPNDKAVTVFLLQPTGKFDAGTTYEVINEQTKVPVQTLEGLIIDLEELFED